MKLTVKKIVEVCHGTLLCGDENLVIENYSKDTRTITKGDCYVGMKGEVFDGNKFYKEAIEKGACACILDSCNETLKESVPIILVGDSVLALQDLAKYVRSVITVPVIAVTGSAGKTSTKDMIAEVLKSKYKVLKSMGNLNGQIGLPLTLLSYQDEDVVVIEMGMNDFGQMSILTHIARPTMAVFTNIGTAHIGILGSKKNILKAKLEILEGMNEGSTLIINNDNDLLSKLDLESFNIVTCGIDSESDFLAKNVNFEVGTSTYEVHHQNESYEVTIPVMGKVFVLNSLLAVAVGTLLEVEKEDIQESLKRIELSGNRMRIVPLKNGITLIDDSYNSNLEAVTSALQILKDYRGKRKIAVLGDILEMEDFKEEIHRKIGSLETLLCIDAIYLCGNATKYIMDEALQKGYDQNKIFHFDTTDELRTHLINYLEINDTILVKASRDMHFKELAQNLEKDLSEK